MPDGAGLDLGPLQELCGTRCIISNIQAQCVWAMDGDTRGAALALVIIILACTAILVGTHATELIGSVPPR